jgi:hypothetical protein
VDDTALELLCVLLDQLSSQDKFHVSNGRFNQIQASSIPCNMTNTQGRCFKLHSSGGQLMAWRPM